MLDQLDQFIGRDFRKFRIVEDGLLVEYKTLGRYDGYRLSWEEIDFDIVVQGRSFDRRRLLRLGSVALNIALGWWVLWLLWPGIRGSWWFTTIAVLAVLSFAYPLWRISQVQRYKKLLGDQTVAFLYRGSDEQPVDAFVERMKAAKRAYLRRRFLQLDDLLPLDDQVATVQSLYVKKMISRDDLAAVLAEVKMRRLFEE